MSRIEDAIRRVGTDLVALGASYALVGGFAVSARTEPRFTRDVDLVVAATEDAAAERLVRELTTRGYAVRAIAEQENAGRLATARLAPPEDVGDELVIDLLFASSGIEGEIVARAEPLELVAGLLVPVATIGDLLALKLLARDDVTRPQDAADLRWLRLAASASDLALARDAVGLITARGYDRGRDLHAALAEL